MLRILDLFSGIGGFSLGLERAGMETAAFCEIDPFCRQVLKKHWPDVPIFEDVRKLRGDHVDSVSVISAGYPCQPYSHAGQRRGEEDDRHLWPEVNRLIREIRPRWFIGENVAGHVTMGLDDVLSDLEGLGYSWEAFVIPAVAVDAPHRRDRVWLVAHSYELADGEQYQYAAPRANCKGSCFDVADTDRERCGQQHIAGIPAGTGFNTRSVDSGWRSWGSESGICRISDGVPNRVDRLRALGNAVVPQVVEVLGRSIMAIECECQGTGEICCGGKPGYFECCGQPVECKKCK